MTVTDTPLIAREPGWLRRAWVRHLHDVAEIDGGVPTRHAYLWSTGVADLLEEFVTDGPDDQSGQHVVHVDGLDAAAASALLADLPDIALQRNFSTAAPSPRKVLTAVVHSAPELTCGGDVVTPTLPIGGLRLWTLTVWDPTLLEPGPDVVASELPDWLDGLPSDVCHAYLQGRQHCLDHALARQAWTRASARYEIDDARRLPSIQVLTDPAAGCLGVRFLW